jgi:glycosyltransferase involved in cell wall biosynthesis
MTESRKRTIVQIGPAHPLRGGNTLFAAHLYEALTEEYDVHAISYSRLYPKLLFPGTRQTDVSAVAIKPHPAETLVDSINPLSWYKTARRIRELNPDIVLYNWWNPFFGPAHGTIARLVAKQTKATQLFVCENLISHESRKVDVTLTRMALQYGDVFMALSGAVKKEIEYFFPGKPVYQIAVPIYDCYTVEPDLTKEEARARLGIDSKHVILFFGYIREYKGLDVLIDAMPDVIKQIPDAHLLIVGESYEKISRYTEQIARLGLQKNTTLINKFVPNEEVGLYFTAGDVVCLPYRSATQSGPLNIAYGMGKPVIVTDVGGLAEFVVPEKTGFVVPPEQPKAITESITAFYQRYSGVNFAEHIFEHNKQNNFNNVHSAFREIFAMRDQRKKPQA